MVVLPPVSFPVIAVSSDTINFYALEGQANPGDQVVAIRNISVPELEWEISYSSGWLTVGPVSGDAASDESDDVTLSADISGLSAGEYDCELTVSDWISQKE